MAPSTRIVYGSAQTGDGKCRIEILPVIKMPRFPWIPAQLQTYLFLNKVHIEPGMIYLDLGLDYNSLIQSLKSLLEAEVLFKSECGTFYYLTEEAFQ